MRAWHCAERTISSWSIILAPGHWPTPRNPAQPGNGYSTHDLKGKIVVLLFFPVFPIILTSDFQPETW